MFRCCFEFLFIIIHLLYTYYFSISICSYLSAINPPMECPKIKKGNVRYWYLNWKINIVWIIKYGEKTIWYAYIKQLEICCKNYLHNMLDDIIDIPLNIGNCSSFSFTESMPQMIVAETYHIILGGAQTFRKLIIPLTMFSISMTYENQSLKLYKIIASL